MNIEEAIQQKKFKNEYQKMSINVIYTASWLETKILNHLKPFGISTQQFNVLHILRGQYPKSSTVRLLIERMLDKNSNASRLVEKLRKKKLVERIVCKEDRRAVNVMITHEGLNLLKKLDKQEKKWQTEMKNLTLKEAEQLNFLLDKLRK